MRFVVSVLVLSSSLLSKPATSEPVIPTRAEQADLLKNVQEVFEEIKLLVKDEGASTDNSVVQDIELMVKRTRNILELSEEVTLLRLSCDSNSVCMLESRPIIKQLAADGRDALSNCTHRGSEDIKINSIQLGNVTNAAIDRGQLLLDALGNCSRKSGLAVISCYRHIIVTDVIPVRNTLLGAIEAHRLAHFKAIEIRNDANVCVDSIVTRYRDMLDKELQLALRCT